jgi:hypothetical protein
VPGTEFVVVADDGPPEQRKGILHRLRRCPHALSKFLTVISSRVFLSGNKALVTGIAIRSPWF